MEPSNQRSLTPSGQEDAALFRRVWRRVMPEERPDCPFTLDEDSPSAPLAVQAEGPEEQYAALLCRLMERASCATQAYRSLSRRLPARTGRMAVELAREKQARLRRLSAACFLLTGVRYQPPSQPTPDRSPALALREHFWAERQEAALCTAAAEGCSDDYLSSLFRSLADEALDHRDRAENLLSLL